MMNQDLIAQIVAQEWAMFDLSLIHIQMCIRDSLKTGASIERTFRPGEKFQEAVMERKQMEYLYFDGEFYVFMDNETFEQSNLTEAQLDGGQRFLKENMVCLVTSFKGEVMEVELPNTVAVSYTHLVDETGFAQLEA